MVRANPAGGDQGGGCLGSDWDIEQTVTVKVAEFVSVRLDELDSAESMRFQPNTRQAEGLCLQRFHGCQTRSVSEAGAGEQQRVK